jgi:hypothetical protein
MLLLTASASIGVGFIVYGSKQWIHSSEPKKMKHDPIEVASLAALSHLWTDNEIEIKDAACLWRERHAKREIGLPRPEFRHSEIEQFYTEVIEGRPSVSGARHTLIIKLLSMLDIEGDCPSVVRANPKEAENLYSNESFAMLATIPLYQHSLTVARNLIAKADHEALLADMIIMALAHDIGKIPSYHDKMYSSGDHPIIAGLILNSIPEYISLPNRDDIDRAITGHHLLKSDNILTNGLKQSDHEARQSELAILYAAARDKQMQAPENDAVTTLLRISTPPAKMNIAVQSTSNDADLEHPLGNYESREQYKPTKQDVPFWFDADAILAAIKTRINVVESTPKGDRWVAVSSNNGLVFVNPDGLWAVIRDVCGDDSYVLASEGNESEKRNLLFTIVNELSRTKDAIATEYVSEGYYTTQASVVTGGAKRITSLLVPFKTKVFSETVTSLEELKTPQLKRMVKEIKLKQTEVEQCVGR